MTNTYGQDQESFGVICRRVLDQAGGRCERNDLAALVKDELGTDGYISATWSRFVDSVVSECRKKDSLGLPTAQSFDGEVIQRSLWSPPQYADSIRARRRSIRDEWSLIKLLQSECEERFGVKVTNAGEFATEVAS